MIRELTRLESGLWLLTTTEAYYEYDQYQVNTDGTMHLFKEELYRCSLRPFRAHKVLQKMALMEQTQ